MSPPRWCDQWPKEQRVLAANLTQKALKTGEIIRQSCQLCGAPNSVAHHEDYDQPLTITWLCRSHHVKRHRELDPSIEIRWRQATARTLAKWKVIDLHAELHGIGIGEAMRQLNFKEGQTKSRDPDREGRGQKLSGLMTGVSALNVSEPEPRVNRLLSEYHRLEPLETFLSHSFWIVQKQRSLIADELARLGVHPFDQPEAGLQP
jgi:hypothetical protein